jgi:hypothetical protein
MVLPNWPVRFALAAASAIAPIVAGAQQLAPVTDAEQCHGEFITEVITHGERRTVPAKPERFAETINGALRTMQPLTPAHVVRDFVLLHAGDRCDENKRRDSERILRSQPYISAVAIRTVPVGPDSVRLSVETIDEYNIFVEGWGVTGVPIGTEIGTTNLFDGARAVSVTGEYGRGATLGGGVKFTDYQAFNQPLRLYLNWASRPLERYASASLARPFLTDFQPYAWLMDVTQSRSYFTFHETSIRDVSLDYDERSWAIGGLRRWPHEGRGFQIGAVVAASYSNPIATVAIRENGPQPDSAPEILARYHPFSALRGGFALGYRDMRFIQVAGLDDLSAVEDVGIGWQATSMLLQGIAVFPNTPPDHVAALNVEFGTGNQVAQLRGGFEIEARAADSSLTPLTAVGAAHATLTLKTSLEHTTLIDLEVAGGANSRLPMQLTFRDDDGLLGYRATDVGGGRRAIWRFEDRWMLPSPYSGADLAIAPLFQAGKLSAGDALYGVSTPWRYSAGLAVMAALPRGSKHMVRLEFGWPLNPNGSSQMEFRMSYGDRSASFAATPNSIVSAREADAAGRAVTP